MSDKKRGFFDGLLKVTDSFKLFLGPAQIGKKADPYPETTDEDRKERAGDLGFRLEKRPDGSTYLVSDKKKQ